MEIFRQFAESGSQNGGLVEMLGIDWQMLLFQIVAFLVMLGLLAKFVYPWLIKSVDDRQKRIEDGLKSSEKAQAEAANAEKRIAKLLASANKEAGEIIAAAKAEASETLLATEEKSRQLADKITKTAREQIDNDILIAKNALHNEMVDLVITATEKVTSRIVTDKVNNDLVEKAVKEAKRN
ncbi:F0F1 ATP synthase subunit B [Candidatus Saccharibacteria bacterium]|nr:F0F1 ATP synthase subunit B [Candidatus Saccharibacteria bacterium]